jgi:hypothetical protein
MSENQPDFDVKKNKPHTSTILFGIGLAISLTGVVMMLFIFGLNYIQFSIALTLAGSVLMSKAPSLAKKLMLLQHQNMTIKRYLTKLLKHHQLQYGSQFLLKEC